MPDSHALHAADFHKTQRDDPLLKLWPKKARASRCAFYHDDGLLDALEGDHSKKVAAFAFCIFEKWLRRRSAYVYTAADSAEREDGDESGSYFVDDEVYGQCAYLLIEAMVYASRADLSISADEHNSMYRVYKAIFAHDDVRGLLDLLLTNPVNLEDLVARVQYREEALDIYELSSLILQGSHFMEAGYLEELSALLYIEPSLKRILDESAQCRFSGKNSQEKIS